MSEPTKDVLHERLRGWARGIYPVEAAKELLIRTGFARHGDPWGQREPSGGTDLDRFWVEFQTMADYVGPMSGGERRLLMFAASLSGVVDAPAVVIGDLVSVDAHRVTLLAAAVAHAGGDRDAWPSSEAPAGVW
ncbi:hypothetical protein [Cellulomonas iranensis]|uniref:hypothetical protein n=1 Tax=Cellulomonas iranensis TaxID=76862 RepID=UPI0013D6487D|nr:hypothetical protein [Cellulomonas iranensis]